MKMAAKSTKDAVPSDDRTTAFFCARSCPGDIILKAQDWANARTQSSPLVIGGFHTAVERDVLRILLRSKAPIELVLARSIVGWRPSRAIKKAIEDGQLVAVTPFEESQRRTTRESALARNRFVLSRCSEAVIAHASPGGATEELAQDAVERGIPLFTFPSRHNANLIELGAAQVTIADHPAGARIQ